MIIDCISDLHGYKPDLEGGDLLIIAGDHTSRDTLKEYEEFIEWLNTLPYRCKVVIGGNHDMLLEDGEVEIGDEEKGVYYLCDSGTEFEGLKIWGSPYTRRFSGQNPSCMAFALHSEFQLKDHFDLIPSDTDILITHTPPHKVLDLCSNGRVGSDMLRQAIDRVRPKLCVFGHIHEDGGKTLNINGINIANCSYVDQRYRPINGPIRFEFTNGKLLHKPFE